MFIGHIPAGYLTSKLLYPALSNGANSERSFIFWGVAGAWAPDIDLLYFYFIDQRQHHHHQYFTHYPLVWLTLLLLSIPWMRIKPKTGTLAFIFCLGGLGHMVLDTIVGDIWWLAPFYDKPFSFFTVPARMHPWWLNFVLHWSFALELALVFGAVYLLWKSNGRMNGEKNGR